MERLQLSPDNQFNGMSRDDFKKMLISMGFEVEDSDGPGYISFEEEEDEEIFRDDFKNCACNYNTVAQYGRSFKSFYFENEEPIIYSAPFAA